MSPKAIKDILKTLKPHFLPNSKAISLPSEVRRILQGFIDENRERAAEEVARDVDQELRSFWLEFVKNEPQKHGAFVGVLRELQPILGGAQALSWWNRVVKGVASSPGNKPAVIGDMQDFLVNCMLQGSGDESQDEHGRALVTKRLTEELLEIYITHTEDVSDGESLNAPDDHQVASQVESVMTAFGRRDPKAFFNALDDLVVEARTRLQALTLVNAFLRHQSPHLYLVINTPLVEHLLKCLMNDTSTTILAVALTSLIMLLPHIPGSLPEHLPRLFLIYSRLLCWEKFSPLSTEAQRNLVTDDRVDTSRNSPRKHDDVGIDPSWEKLRPKQGLVEEGTPELLTYFTYLYGLYPLNLMSYVRKPRRFLKKVDFAGAEEFDLDQSVIRSRTQQYQQVHLLHPNFFNMNIEEELADPKWPKMDPADVVGECHSLRINSQISPSSPAQRPRSGLQDMPSIPPLSLASKTRDFGGLSPSASHTSFKSIGSGRNTPSTAVSVAAEGDSPVLKPQLAATEESMMLKSRSRFSNISMPMSNEESPPGGAGAVYREKSDSLPVPTTNLTFLQNQLALLRNELSFERWHKSQYSEHIGQISRKNVRDATIDAELLNLTNANRALKQQLENVQKAREAAMKDAALTRKQASSSEAYLTERMNKLKKKEDQWQADSDELTRFRSDTDQMRELLVASEARELNQQHKIKLLQRDLEELRALRDQYDKARQKVREYEYRDFEALKARREVEILRRENATLRMRLEGVQDEQSPMKRSSRASQALTKRAVTESDGKLLQLRKAHTHLDEIHTDSGQAHGKRSYDGTRNATGRPIPQTRGSNVRSRSTESREIYNDAMSIRPQHTATKVCHSDPSSYCEERPATLLSHGAIEATIQDHAGLPAAKTIVIPRKPPTFETKDPNLSILSNKTAQHSPTEATRSKFPDASDKKNEVQPDAEARSSARGGSQTSKSKPKDQGSSSEKSGKRVFLRGFR